MLYYPVQQQMNAANISKGAFLLFSLNAMGLKQVFLRHYTGPVTLSNLSRAAVNPKRKRLYSCTRLHFIAEPELIIMFHSFMKIIPEPESQYCRVLFESSLENEVYTLCVASHLHGEFGFRLSSP